MRLETGFTWDAPGQFLMALNRRSLIFVPIFAEQERIPAPPPLEFYLRPKDEALNRQSREAFLSRLCGLADEWIETGRDASGEGEDPTKRKLTRELWRVVNEWWATNRPDVVADYSGEPTLSMPVFKTNFTGDGVLLKPVDAAKQEAVRWFAWFLNLPHRYRLCKCRLCDEYYYLGRRPKRFIQYGTYCPRHRQVATAKRSNEQRRGPAHERRLIVAAEWWGRWPKQMMGDVGKQAQWIAKKVNENVIHKWTPIRRNWVTRHRPEIEARSQALKNCERKSHQKLRA